VSQIEIRIGGFGGQGVIMAGLIVGKAAAIHDNKEATFTRSYGPEARGSACSAQIIIADEDISYPYVVHPDILIVMSQEAYDKFHGNLSSKGILVVESELIKTHDLKEGQSLFGIPATRLAEELGRRIVLNMVMLGFFSAVTDVISVEAMKQAIRASVPRGTEELNLLAFRRGYEYAGKQNGDEEPKEQEQQQSESA
jgi:2-oxoglutarate ferredoxin oxidoreductase subunit gamma